MALCPGLAGIVTLLGSWYRVVLWICYEHNVDNTLVLAATKQYLP